MSNKTVEEYLKEQAAEKAKRDAEIQRLADENDKCMKAELEEEAPTLFYSGNPDAAPSLWQTVRDEYRRLVMRRRAEAAASQSHSLYKW